MKKTARTKDDLRKKLEAFQLKNPKQIKGGKDILIADLQSG